VNRAERRRAMRGHVRAFESTKATEEQRLATQAKAMRATILANDAEPLEQRLELVTATIAEIESSGAGAIVAGLALEELRGLRADLAARLAG